MNHKSFNPSLILSILFALTACSTSSPNLSKRSVAQIEPQVELIETLPQLTSDKGELKEALKKALKTRMKKPTDEELSQRAETLKNYLFFLGLSAKDLIKAEKEIPAEPYTLEAMIAEKKPAGDEGDTGGEEEDKTPSNLKAVQRLFIASMQFLNCSSMLDWECLEKTPKFTPTADFRIENSELGKPVRAGDSLDMDVYFTQGWDGSEKAGLAKRFTEKLEEADKSLSLAMYGIDDIEGSMSGVYSKILEKSHDKRMDVRAVVDVMGFEKTKTPWIFTYKNLSAFSDRWVFGESSMAEKPKGMRLNFQYDGTSTFLRDLNKDINLQDDSRARIEWTTARIMHNKYAVIENHTAGKSVWTGTANISKNCMGVEANANMAVYIKNEHIAQAFLDQFNLMFDFDQTLKVKSKLVEPTGDEPSMAGRFHRNKFPVSKRLFTFDDGTNLRVHFAPTDDAEHRVIIPMLLSAQAGDEIRISMFGGTGFEIVRAMQYAVAKGANIRIAFDRRLGHGLTSWIRDAVLNVHMPNPYIKKLSDQGIKPGKISVRVSTWPGKNHYKAGTITRKKADGSMVAEELIVGSQNWSGGGNDFNDENLISIQNTILGVKAAQLFNHEFDTRLWVKSREEKPFTTF